MDVSQLFRLTTCSVLCLCLACGDDDPGSGDAGSPDATSDMATGADADREDAADADGEADADVGCTPEATAWQPFAIDFEGPAASETDTSPNPFTDHRLQVEFVSPSGQRFDVPGTFEGDGSGGAMGTTYRVRFTVDEPGEWSWTASFESGPGIALDRDAAGEPMGPDGESGVLCVGGADASAPGFYGRGRLTPAGHYLQLSDGSRWLKAGADSPENFLGYVGFDGVEDLPGGASTEGLADGLHRYTPHERDWVEGDPDWGDGAGRGIIGALNYLASEEVNSIYFLPCNLGGDGRDTHPYVSPDDLMHFDLSRMAQWEIVLAHAQRLGIALHVVLNETEEGNETLHDGGELGPQRRLYYRELVARFGHHNALMWNIGEENDYGAARQKEFAAFIAGVDVYDHPTTVHTHPNRLGEQYDGLLGDPNFDMTSVQFAPARGEEFVETWRRRSREAGREWAIMMDEINPAGVGLTDMNAPEMRRVVLWPSYMSGSGGVEWYFGYHPLPLGGDMRTEDFRTREEMWTYMRYARRFFEEHLPFWEMEPRDELLEGAPGDVFALEGEVYAVYLPSGGPARLRVGASAGELSLRYWSPTEGRFAGDARMVDATTAIELAPPGDGDWVVLLEGSVTIPEAPEVECDVRSVDGVVMIEAEDLPVSAEWRTGSDPDALGGGYLEWTGASSFSSPRGNEIRVLVEIDTPGRYELRMRSAVGRGSDSTEHNDTWMRWVDASSFFGAKDFMGGESRVFPRPTCEDASFLSAQRALPGVSRVGCPAGGSGGDYFKVYSSGSVDWQWTGRTSDNDGHRVYATFDSPGVYTFEIAPRSDFHRVDRIAFVREGVTADLERGPTTCD